MKQTCIDIAEEADLSAIATMFAALNDLHARQMPSRFRSDVTVADLEGFLRDRIATGAQAVVYRTEGVARGYLLWLVDGRAGDVLRHPRKVATLDQIYVDPICRRRGVARRMIRFFEMQAQLAGCSEWVATQYAFNNASQSLLQGAGAASDFYRLAKRL